MVDEGVVEAAVGGSGDEGDVGDFEGGELGCDEVGAVGFWW